MKGSYARGFEGTPTSQLGKFISTFNVTKKMEGELDRFVSTKTILPTRVSTA